jgi:hypothetical protein
MDEWCQECGAENEQIFRCLNCQERGILIELCEDCEYIHNDTHPATIVIWEKIPYSFECRFMRFPTLPT